MSLLKRLALTTRKLEANQANARMSQGPATAEGIERIREARLVHGFYSKGAGESVRALGEKPEDFERLLASLTETWQPETGYEEMLVRRLARALWRVERADRIQEAMTVSRAERVTLNLEDHEEKAAADHKRKLAILERLTEQSQHSGFRAGKADLDDIQQILGNHATGRAGDILYLVWRLMSPTDPAAHAIAGQVRALEGGRPQSPENDGSDTRDVEANDARRGVETRPELAPATGDERNRLRAQLRSMLRQEIEAQQAEYRRSRDRRGREVTSAVLDAAMAPDDPQADLMLRTETAAFRQVKQITEMLMQFRQFNRPKAARPVEEAAETPQEIENEGKSHDVVENKG